MRIATFAPADVLAVQGSESAIARELAARAHALLLSAATATTRPTAPRFACRAAQAFAT